ncbi:MAG: DUF397 domain-containing protein [Acidimicrobiales bacterium]
MCGVFSDGVIAVKDSNNPTAPPLVCTPGEWATFTAVVRDGEC